MDSLRNVCGLAGMAGLFALVTPALAAGEGITIPKGTAVELVLMDRLGTRTAKVGDTFRTRLVRALYVDGQPALPYGTVVEGRVVLVKSPRDGGLSGVIGVEFVSLRPADGQAKVIHGKLTSLRQDDRRRMVELAQPVMAPPARTGVAAAPDVQHIDVQYIYVSPETVARAQQALTERKYYGGEADGELGAATRNAIIRFQLDHEQVAAGDLDEETLRLLGLPPPPRL